MTTTINLRISSELRNKLDELAEEKNVSTSEVTRLILENYFENELDFEEEIYNSVQDPENLYVEDNEGYFEQKYNELLNKELEIKPSLIHSLEFLQLVSWIFDQKALPIQSYSKKQRENFRDTIIQINGNPIFSQDLKKEFNKVLADLIKVEDSFLYGSRQLDFAKKAFFNGFNYRILKEFLFENNCELIKKTI
ncbi:CopG family transcriptional regulator [Lutibacter sp.]|uniref:ribbon-helix-helix domain-containing protein n=1 Tax=Lutibacter sp. TaxID=1925666 RepID=UPI0035615B8D